MPYIKAAFATWVTCIFTNAVFVLIALFTDTFAILVGWWIANFLLLRRKKHSALYWIGGIVVPPLVFVVLVWRESVELFVPAVTAESSFDMDLYQRELGKRATYKPYADIG